jgi:hypothetical protein
VPAAAAAFLTFLTVSCSTRPWNVLPENRMEVVLYDLYMADAEVSENYGVFMNDSARKAQLLESVLEQHGITRARLDSSLAWYADNLDRYVKINENITKRYDEFLVRLKREQADSLAAAEARTVLKNRFVIDEPYFFITSADLVSDAYRFLSDTTVKGNGGDYKLSFNIFGVSDSIRAEVSFRIACSDTVFIHRDTVSVNGYYSSSISVLPEKQATGVSGDFHFRGMKPGVLLYVGDLSVKRNL